jgi:hypothetical protein
VLPSAARFDCAAGEELPESDDIVDLDGDGWSDIVKRSPVVDTPGTSFGGHNGHYELRIWMRNAGGVHSAGVHALLRDEQVASWADFDGNGVVDLLVVEMSVPLTGRDVARPLAYHLYPGRGDGTFDEKRLFARIPPAHTLDRIQTMIRLGTTETIFFGASDARPTERNVYVRSGTTELTQYAQTYSANASLLGLIDVDQDAQDDLVLLDTDGLHQVSGHDLRELIAPLSVALPPSTRFLGKMDVDSDGRMDLVGHSTSAVVLHNDGMMKWTARVENEASPAVASGFLADISGDGREDLVLSRERNVIEIRRSNGASFDPATLYFVPGGVRGVVHEGLRAAVRVGSPARVWRPCD